MMDTMLLGYLLMSREMSRMITLVTLNMDMGSCWIEDPKYSERSIISLG
jgi:hypothetical protein